ncbi:hypothetical protein GQ54DRAFT_299686 [Martensiomyces pterosporus]|nr:hypothetical protein GQ54DRAFT_299686 [Martensiomyces pterosporus]
MDAGSEIKWPNLRSYVWIYNGLYFGVEESFSCLDITRQLDKELPKLRQASPVTRDVSSCITPLVYNPPSVSFLTQLTSLRLSCDYKGVDANCLPRVFAPTLVSLALDVVNTKNIWNIFCDGQEGQTVLFARLRHLDVTLGSSSKWRWDNDSPSHFQGATDGAPTKRSVWQAGAASGEPGCRVPLFPVLQTLRCTDMAYGFREFVSRTQCHNSLVLLDVSNRHLYFDFDAELFKSLETAVFNASLRDRDEGSADSVDLYKSAFTSLLRTKTNIQRMAFRSSARDMPFQVPPEIGCANLRSLFLGVEVEFKPMLRLLGSLKHIVELELDVDSDSTYVFGDGRGDAAEDADELQPPQADCPPVSNTLRHFTCRLCTPRVRCCYTASYALGLALHLPALESMSLTVRQQSDVAFYEAMLGRFLQKLSGSPYMNDGLLNAKVVSDYSIPWFIYPY